MVSPFDGSALTSSAILSRLTALPVRSTFRSRQPAGERRRASVRRWRARPHDRGRPQAAVFGNASDGQRHCAPTAGMLRAPR
eukprot:SAG11_NODE_3745_length_2253_cov_9.767874_1_plen_81_part_10